MSDIADLLTADHRDLLNTIDSLEPGDSQAVARLRRLLPAHAQIEVEVLVPALIRWGGQADDADVAAMLREQVEVRTLVSDLEATSPGGEEYVALVGRLRDWTTAHIEQAESRLLRPAEELIPPVSLVEIGLEAVRLRGLQSPGDAGASSDGDSSWHDEPVSEDPALDRSVDAALRRSTSTEPPV